MLRLFRQFSSPGRHPEPRLGDHARLDPRGRRAGLRAGARVRRGDGQPGPARPRRGRRRRGRDRPAGGLLEGHLVPQPGPRRRGAADPAPQRRQDLRPDRARPQGPGRGPVAAARATATTCIEVDGRRPARHAPPVRRRAGRGLGQDPGDPGRGPGGELGRHPAALADDRAAHARRAGPGRTWSTASRCRAPGARTRCRCPASGTTRSTWRCWRLAAVVPAGGALRRRRRARPNWCAGPIPTATCG